MMARLSLFAWLLVIAMAGGAVAWRAIHRLTGGAWGQASQATLERLTWLLPLAALGAVVFLFAAGTVLPWIDTPVEPQRHWYFDRTFLAVRTLACIAIWAAGAWLARRLPALVLILWLLACGTFSTDWIASLAPAWRSSALGVTFACMQLSLALSIAAGFAATKASPDVRADLGALLLAACLGWAYLAGVDYLTAWIADQPYETGWYLPRVRGPFATLAVAAALLHLAAPFAMLIARQARRRVGVLRAAALSIALGEACHLAWMVLP